MQSVTSPFSIDTGLKAWAGCCGQSSPYTDQITKLTIVGPEFLSAGVINVKPYLAGKKKEWLFGLLS